MPFAAILNHTPYFSRFELKCSYFSDLSWSKKKVNFRQADGLRKFALRTKDGEVFYVNPGFLRTISEDFCRRYTALKDTEGGELDYQDITSEEMRRLLEAICPTVLNLYPQTFQIHSLPLMTRLSHRMRIDGLKKCCEKMIEVDLFPGYLDPTLTMKIFDAAYRYRLSEKIQVRLLGYVLANKPAAYSCCDEVFSTRTGNFYAIALSKHLNGEFAHCGHIVEACGGDSKASTAASCTKCAVTDTLFGKRSRRQKCRQTRGISPLWCHNCTETLCLRCGGFACPTLLASFVRAHSQLPPLQRWSPHSF